MNIILDTHALKKVFIPTIVLLELLYAMRKVGNEDKFPAVLKVIKKHRRYVVVSLDILVVEKTTQVNPKLEMHDRVIVATSEMLQLPLITKDPEIRKVYNNVIW